MRIYESGKLIKILCDECDASIRPNPHIATSGWVKAWNNPDPLNASYPI